MDELIIRRCVTTAHFMLEHRATIRQAAAHFSQAKSSVHKDMCERLPQIDKRLAQQVGLLLAYNKAVRPLRGGEATRLRYLGLHSASNAL